MAVIKQPTNATAATRPVADTRPRRTTGSALQALTAAALALPGLAPTALRAADANEADFQYGHYEEGPRRVFESNTAHKPIQVDSLRTGAGLTLSDRMKLRFTYLQDTWSGATPITTAPVAAMAESETGASGYVTNTYAVDNQLRPLRLDPVSGELVQDSRLIHMISSASPETRRQTDITLGYEWDERALDIGAGASIEDDYDSRYVSGNLRWDLHQKLTTLNVGVSYTDSDIRSLRNPIFSGYIDYGAHADPSDPTHVVGTRHDWTTFLGLSQVINKNSVLETGLGYTRSSGFQENAYKPAIFTFVDPAQTPGPSGELIADAIGVLENRPDERDQWTWSLRYVRYMDASDAALHLDYRLFHDNWGIDAHTLEAAWTQPLGAGWTLTPRVRYYTQDEAKFYQPYYVFNQAMPIDPDTNRLDLDQVPIEDFSSDYRLASYGALSTGLTLSKQLGNGAATVEAGIEYYRHEAALAWRGRNDGDFSDFNSLMFNLGLRVNLSAPSSLGANEIPTATNDTRAHDDHGGHGTHADHTAHRAPAGVMGDHLLPKAGDVMVGYRYLYNRQSGDTLRGSDSVSDEVIVNNGCGDNPCSITPSEMSMHMHMLEIMYAATDRFNIMIMPQLMDMDMSSRMIGDDSGGGHATHVGHEHATGGIGDTLVSGLFKLYETPGHQLNIGLGLSVPTGSVEEKTRVQVHDPDTGEMYSTDEFVHFGMQLGSGTWDFLPSLTYTGYKARWSWGAQLSGVHRLEDENDSGYALGNVFQATAWGSYGLNQWLSASLRGAYMAQSSISGEYNDTHAESSPADLPYNYGGRFSDIGIGLSAAASKGDLKGNTLSIEWLEPVMDHPYGYQLERKGTLYATWTLAF